MNVLSGEPAAQRDDPQKEIDRLVRDLKRKLTEGRARLSGAVRDGKLLQRDCGRLKLEIQRHLKEARTLLTRGDEGAARRALGRKVQAEQLLADMSRELERQRQAILSLQTSLKELAEKVRVVEHRRRNLKVKLRRTRALAARAEIREKRHLEGADSLLDELDARLEVEEELLSAGSAGDSLERRFAELEQSGEICVGLLEEYGARDSED